MGSVFLLGASVFSPFRLFASYCVIDFSSCGDCFESLAPCGSLFFFLPPFRRAGWGVVSGCTLCCFSEASSPPARWLSSERGVSAPGCSSGARFLLLGSFAGGGFGSSLLAADSCCRSARPRLPLPSHHCMLREVMVESLRWPAPVRDPPVLPGLRLEKHGRIVEPAFGRVALVTGLVARALAPLPARVQAVEKVVGVTRLNCCLPLSFPSRSLMLVFSA